MAIALAMGAGGYALSAACSSPRWSAARRRCCRCSSPRSRRSWAPPRSPSAAALLGDLRPGALTIAGWGRLAALAAVSTVAALTLFFAGLRRVGPTSASILSTIEPVATIALAFVIFGETHGALQLAGGTLVLAAALERMTA